MQPLYNLKKSISSNLRLPLKLDCLTHTAKAPLQCDCPNVSRPLEVSSHENEDRKLISRFT